MLTSERIVIERRNYYYVFMVKIKLKYILIHLWIYKADSNKEYTKKTFSLYYSY